MTALILIAIDLVAMAARVVEACQRLGSDGTQMR